MLPAPPPPWSAPLTAARLRELRRRAGPVSAARSAAEAVATGPAREIKTDAGRVWAVPVYRGWVAVDPVPAGGPVAWRFHSYGPGYRNWAGVATATEAAARAGYGVRAAVGVDCRFTLSRMWVGAGWVAFADALDLAGGESAQARFELGAESGALAEGFLAGTTPAGVVLDYLAERGPIEAREGFARLAARCG